MKKLAGLLLATLTLAVQAHGAQAEVITYQGTLESQPVTLAFDVQTPSSITTTVTSPVNDPDGTKLPGSTKISAAAGTVSLTYNGQTLTGTLAAFGSTAGSTLNFSFEAYFPLQMQGAINGGPMYFDGSDIGTTLSADQQEITGLQFPQVMNVAWELAGNYPTDILTACGNAPIIQLTRQ